MLKRIIVFFVMALFLLNSFGVFAVDDNFIIEDVSAFTGKLYLSDFVDYGVVLKDVKPLCEGEKYKAYAKALEYNEIGTYKDNIISRSSKKELDINSLAWYLDMEVKVIAAKMHDGNFRILMVETK